MKRAIASLVVLCLAAPGLARASSAVTQEDPAFAVLRIVRGDEIRFQPVLSREAADEKARISREARSEIAAWELRRDAARKARTNQDQEFLELKPEPASVTTAKDRIPTEEEAHQYAEEQQKKAEGKYAVIRVTGTDGLSVLEALPQKKIRAREAELRAKYAGERDDWQARAKAHYERVARAGISGGQPADGLNPVSTSGSAWPFTQPQPREPRLVRLKEGLADREQGEKLLQELERNAKIRG